MNDEIVFPYKKAGVPVGFSAAPEGDFVFKPCKYSAAVINLETLKKNLRLMVKSKEAKLIKAGTIESVSVPSSKFLKLFE